MSSWKVCCARIPQRWIFAVMGCLALTNAYAMQICLSLAITQMVKTRVTSSNGTVSDEACPSSESTIESLNSDGMYEWDEYTQGVILSSFFWGYIVTQIPGGLLAEKLGGKQTLGLGIFFTAILTLVTPITIQAYGSTGLIILRVLMGVGTGTSYPATSVLISQWAPPNERSKIGSLVGTGFASGTVLGYALTGLLIEHSPIGWPIVFYFFGALGVLWYLAWVVLCYSNPEVHPFISDEEKNYIRESMRQHTNTQGQPTPWRHILTSGPVWALISGKFGALWSFFTLSTDLPKYMSGVLKFSIQANGLLTALPYIFLLVVSIGSAWPADWLIASGKMSRTNVRKLWSTIGSIVPAVFIIAASYAGCDRTAVVIFFTIGVASTGLRYPSLGINGNDLSPNFAGTIMGLVSVSGVLAGILATYVVGLLTPNQTLSEWRIVFWITVVIMCSASLIYVIWGSGEVQYWNDPQTKVHRENQVERVIETSRNLDSDLTAAMISPGDSVGNPDMSTPSHGFARRNNRELALIRNLYIPLLGSKVG